MCKQISWGSSGIVCLSGSAENMSEKWIAADLVAKRIPNWFPPVGKLGTAPPHLVVRVVVRELLVHRLHVIARHGERKFDEFCANCLRLRVAPCWK